MRVTVRLQLDVDDATYFRLKALMTQDRPQRIQLHARDMPASHLGDGILLGIQPLVGASV